MMSDFLGAKGPTILGNALHNSWYFLVQILRELRRAPPRVLRIMQIISRLGRSLPPSICRHFHYSHARYTAPQPARRVIMRSFFANRPPHSLSLLEKHARAISHQFNRSTHRPTNEPHLSSVNQSMPTHQQITAAREQGSDVHATICVGQQEQQAPLPLRHLPRPQQDLHDAETQNPPLLATRPSSPLHDRAAAHQRSPLLLFVTCGTTSELVC